MGYLLKLDLGKHNLSDCWSICGLFLWKTYLNNRFKLPRINLLQIGIIKSRLHYFKNPNLKILWFLDFRTRRNPDLFTLLYRNAAKNARNDGHNFGTYDFYESGNPNFWKFVKTYAPFLSLKLRVPHVLSNCVKMGTRKWWKLVE